MSNITGPLNSRGAAATGHQLTTLAAIEVITAGGNAFDGAIAAAFMACVCEPVLASPGGGGFAMIHKTTNGKKSTSLLDFFAQTPLNKNPDPRNFIEIDADFGTAIQKFHIGHASSATPGFIPGLFALHKKHARLPMTSLIAPARDAAIKGVEITSFQNYLSSVVAPILLHSEQSRAIFAPRGKLHKPGEIFQNHDLANFLDQIGLHGQKIMPTKTIVSAQQNGGHLRADDLTSYGVIERASHIIDISGSKVHLNPRPAAGGILIAQIFEHLDGFEPIRIANALAKVDINRRQSGFAPGPPANRGTTHISVVDGDQNACAMTLSNGEGNGHMVSDCGFMLNNMLGEADINPGGKLDWRENTRMSSMMCPTIVEHRDGATIALGSGGSNRIRSAISQVLINLLLNNDNIETSINKPRLHIEEDHLDFEYFDNEQISNQLKTAFVDHRHWRQKNMFFGGCHLAQIGPDQTFDGFGDPRRHGFFATT